MAMSAKEKPWKGRREWRAVVRDSIAKKVTIGKDLKEVRSLDLENKKCPKGISCPNVSSGRKGGIS